MKNLLCSIFVLVCSAFLTTGSSTPFSDLTPADIPSQIIQASRTPQKEITQVHFVQPEQDTETQPANQSPKVKYRWQKYRIQRGDTLSRILNRPGINTQTLPKVPASNRFAEDLIKVRPGKEIEVLVGEAGVLERLRYRLNRIDTLEIAKTESGYVTTQSGRSTERRTAHANGLIHSSLSRDAKAAGLSDKLIMELTKIFAWDIDFALGIRKGDEFTVIYEQSFVDDQFYGEGNILAAEFISRGKSHTAIRFTNEQGVADYYTPDGHRLRQAFLRTPVQFARISSHFNLHRHHPVLNRIRAHKGVDYAAPTGTPVRATGDGKIAFRGHQGGYGRVVIVQHGKNCSTVYAHLSRFGKGSPGSHVNQGQTIGYVGASGLATGPHLHYEFRINGVHRNPLTVKLPNTLPIEEDSLNSFKVSTASLLGQLELYRSTLLAQADYKQALAQ
ncbi:MAG: peptidoglycan DD-metalloendopeptidase family protein [Methylococcales bacterium]